jgi:hypothetical protein
MSSNFEVTFSQKTLSKEMANHTNEHQHFEEHLFEPACNNMVSIIADNIIANISYRFVQLLID